MTVYLDPLDYAASQIPKTAGGVRPDDFNVNVLDAICALKDLLEGVESHGMDYLFKPGLTWDFEVQLGDAGGVQKVIIRDSGGVEVAAIDSDGNITLSGTIDGVDLAAHVLDADAHHVSFVAADHTAIGDGAPHHAAATAIDGQHTIAGQVISGVDAAAAQKGHIQLTGHLGGTAALPDVRGLRETAGPTLLTLGAIADGEYLVRSGNTVVGGAGGAAIDLSMLHEHTYQEDQSLACDGVKTNFITANEFEQYTTEIFLDGALLQPGAGNDYEEDVTLDAVTLAVAPAGGSILLMAYMPA